jgi:hypothetical protein
MITGGYARVTMVISAFNFGFPSKSAGDRSPAALVEHVRLGMVDSRRNNHRWFPPTFRLYHHRRETLSSSPAMSSSSSSIVNPSDGDRKLTESPTPFSEGQWDHEIIPKTHNNRTLVLCFDGTGDKFDSDVRKPVIDTLFSHHHLHFRFMAELERRPLHITFEEGQQARPDGLLSGTSIGSPVWYDAHIL